MRRNVNRKALIPVPRYRTSRRMVARPKPKGTMNKVEAIYSIYLETNPGVVKYRYECVTFQLGPGVRYTPDFMVTMLNGSVKFVDVKALWRGREKPHVEDDALVKIKVAAGLYGEYAWQLVWLHPQLGWQERVFNG